MTVYVAEHPTEPNRFVLITHHVNGYHDTDLTAEHAARVNAEQNVSPAEVTAAVTCSMFGNWEDFDKIVTR